MTDRETARADARAAADRAHALRLQSDAAWLAGDPAESLRLLAAARAQDTICDDHCRTAAAIPPRTTL